MDALKAKTIESMELLDLAKLHIYVKQLYASGLSISEILELLQVGMKLVGDKFAQGDYFLADLIVSGMMLKSALALLPVSITQTQTEPYHGRVLIGVVAGDIHDIGKDIVIQVLRTERFDILDLGVAVPLEAFIQAAQNYRPDIIALSGVMGDSVTEMKSVIDALTKEGIHPGTPIVVGGASVNKQFAEKIGADYYACNPIDTMQFCKKVMEEKENYEKR